MKYTYEFREKLSKAVLEKAEQLASEVDENGLTGEIMTVSVGDEEFFEFLVDVTVTNIQREEETNSLSYNAEVFCTRTPNHNNKNLRIFMIQEFYLETLYKDE